VNSAAGRCAIHCAKLYRVPAVRAIQERVYHRRKFDTVDQLKQAIVLECSTTTHHGASLITACQHWIMETSFAVCLDQNGGSLNIRFNNCPHSKIIVVKDVVLKYFLK